MNKIHFCLFSSVCLLISSCNSEDSYVTGQVSSTSGQAIFWTASGTLGGSYIEIFVDGVSAGKLTSYYSNGVAPNCGSQGSVTITKSPGNYTWSGTGQDNTKFTGTVIVAVGTCVKVQITSSNIGTSQLTTIGTYAIKNVWKGTYLNISNNTVLCSNIATTQLPAQWLFQKVGATNNILIMNKATNTYLSMDNTTTLTSTNIQSLKTQWIQETYSTNVFRYKNADNNNYYINIESGSVSSSAIQSGWLSAQWNIEPK